VVEDDEDARDLLSMVLRRCGLGVVGVGDVASALAVISSCDVGVVLLDVSLPDGSGFEVCTAVRDHPEMRRVPVVLVTGQDALDRELEGILRGADAYLVKPVSTSTLLNRLCDLI
jgi:DNA-binding response OmpR family regulator